jgi:hypothetical protein
MPLAVAPVHTGVAVAPVHDIFGFVASEHHHRRAAVLPGADKPDGRPARREPRRAGVPEINTCVALAVFWKLRAPSSMPYLFQR